MAEKEMGYSKKIKESRIEYTINWSEYFFAANKFEVLKKMTEMTGIFVIFYLNKYKRLSPVMLGAAWYTGLRPSILKVYTRSSVDSVPEFVYSKIENEKIYIKYLEIYVLEDMLNILFKLKEQYRDAFFDTNGLQPPENIEFVRLVEKDIKVYHKTYPHPDI